MKDKSLNRPILLAFRVSEREKKIIEGNALSNNKKVSDFLRDVALNTKEIQTVTLDKRMRDSVFNYEDS